MALPQKLILLAEGKNMKIDKNTVLTGLTKCSEFLCDECPYQKYDDETYKMRCMHMLMVDIKSVCTKEIGYVDIAIDNNGNTMPWISKRVEWKNVLEDEEHGIQK
jgi:hypothetical protein